MIRLLLMVIAFDYNQRKKKDRLKALTTERMLTKWLMTRFLMREMMRLTNRHIKLLH
jgi:hypothetical protein